jgi:hypothetical protein
MQLCSQRSSLQEQHADQSSQICYIVRNRLLLAVLADAAVQQQQLPLALL